MLVLSRKPDEIIYIVNEDTGEVITLTILDCRGKTVKVGLDGEKNYKFIRKEVYDRHKEPTDTVLPSPEKPLEVDKGMHVWSGE